MAVIQAPDHLRKWIARSLADLTEEGLIHRFELFHSVDDRAERLEICKVRDKETEADDIAQLLYDSAAYDASTRPGSSQRYIVGAFRSEQQLEPETQFPFRIVGQGATAWTGGDTEQPTEKGERAQNMRMMNELHNTMMRFADSFGGRMSHMLDKERERSEKLEQRLRERNVDFEDLQDRKLDREMLRNETLLRQKLMTDVFGSLTPLIPLVTGKLIGGFMGDKNGQVAKALVPHDPSKVSRDQQLREFLGMLEDSEKEGVFQALSAGHKITLIQIGQSFADNSEMQKAARDEAVRLFLKSLETLEFARIMGALSPASQGRFMNVYKAYADVEAERQEDLPEGLKDQPPKPAAEATAE